MGPFRRVAARRRAGAWPDGTASTGTPAAGAPSTGSSGWSDSPGGIVAQVADELGHGMTVADCAARHNLPRDFIVMIAAQARRRGLLTVVDLQADGTVCGVCAPDPDSIVCAGCPLRSSSARRRARGRR